MKKYLALYFVFHLLTATGQIQFTRTDFGVEGDKVTYAVDTPTSLGYNFGATGANHTWRFNSKRVYPRRYDSTLFIAASSNPNAPALVTNMLIRSIGKGDQYQEITNNFVKTIFDFPELTITGIKLQTLNFPLTYQSSFTDSTTATVKGTFADFKLEAIPPFDSIRFNAKVNITSTCDGWGTLILPDTTSHQVLRVNQLITVEADVYLHSIIGWTYITHRSQTLGNYNWYGPDAKNFLARVELDSSGNFTSFTYKVKAVPVSIKAELVSVSPDTIMQGDTIDIIIKGYQTTFNQTTADPYVAGCSVLSSQVLNDSTIKATITCTFTTSPGTYYIRAFDPNGGYLYLDDAITVIAGPDAPKLVSMSPNFGTIGEQTTVTVTGKNTHFNKGLSIYFNPDSTTSGTIYVRSFDILNDTLFTCKVQVDDIGSFITFSLRAYSPVDGNLYLDGIFRITPTGIAEQLPSVALLYPNPVKDNLIIRIPQNSGECLIRIFDVHGKEVKRSINSAVETTINMTGLRDPLYFCKVVGEHINTTQKILIEP